MLQAASPSNAARHRGLALVFASGALYSTAGLFTRALPYDAWTVLGWRSLFATLFMVGLIAVQSGRLSLRDYSVRGAHLALVPTTAIGTVCYIFALKLTTVADVMIVYATLPFVTALVGWLWTGERPGRRTLIASSLALLGVAVMISGAALSPARLLGAGLTMVMNVTFALTIVLARRRPETSMVPVNALGILLAALVGFACSPGIMVGPGAVAIAGLFGLLTTGLAMWLLMAGARTVPSAEVALVGTSDTAIGPILVWLAYGENPGLPAMVGGAVVGAALLWHMTPDLVKILRR